MFLYFAGVVLAVTASAKFISAAGSSRILDRPGPILQIPFRAVFMLSGFIECGIAVMCITPNRKTVVQAASVAWLATTFVFYRFGLFWVHYHRPCPCLGNLTDAIHIPPQTADTAMKLILAYLLIGSYGSMIWLWNEKRKGVAKAKPKSVARIAAQ